MKTTPKKLCLLISNTRSRSTYFLDFIRTMESVDMAREYNIFRRLFLRGRRYPQDLADIVKDSEHQTIEMAPGRYQKLPSIVEKHKIHYYVEKIHPHFIKLPYWLFGLILRFYYRDCKCIFLVREPEASLRSYIKYCYWNPDWGEARHQTPDFITKQYKRIYELYILIGGTVFTNNQLDSLDKVSGRLGTVLQVEQHDVKKHINNFRTYNNEMYDLRKAKSPFVSDDIPIDLSPYAQALNDAKLYYDKLLNIAEKS